MRLRPFLDLLSVSASASTQLPFSSEQVQEVPVQDEHHHRLVSSSTRHFLAEKLEEWGVPGMAVAAIKARPDRSEGFDVEFVNLGTAGSSVGDVTEDTLFGIASNSKAFTAGAVASLVEKGAFEWTDKATGLLSGILAFKDPVAHAHADLLDILSHKTGLPRHDAGYSFGESHLEFVRKVKGYEPSVEFRKEWQYNNVMFGTAAFLVANKTGSHFTDYVTKHFFEQLGMDSTTYAPMATAKSRAAFSDGFGTLWNNSIYQVPWIFPTDPEGIQVEAGPGGVVSSTRDLAKWVEFLITQRNATTSNDDDNDNDEDDDAKRTKYNAVLSGESVKLMTSIQTPQQRTARWPEMSAAGYGTGFSISTYKGLEFIYHGGAIPGFGSQIVWNSWQGIGAIALCNTVGTGNSLSDIATRRVFEDLAGLEHHTDWHARYRAAYEMQLKMGRPDGTTGSKAPALDESFFGTFEDAAGSYPRAALCPVPSSPGSVETRLKGTTHSKMCKQLYALLGNAVSGDDASLPGHDSEPLAYWFESAAFGTGAYMIEPLGFNETLGTYAVTGVNVFGPAGERKANIALAQGGQTAAVRFSRPSSERSHEVKAEWWGVWGPGPEQSAREEKNGFDGHKPELVLVRSS